MRKYELKCPECGGIMYSYEQYYVYKESKKVQICKTCSNKRRVRRMFVKVKGKTIVVD